MAYDPAELPDLEARLDAELRRAEPEAILARAIEAFPGSLALVSSFGAESAVLLHMVGKLQPDLPILFLDTGMLFAQTLDYRQALSKRLGLTQVRDLRPAFADLATTDPGSDLWRRDTDTCCEVRKVLPLERGLGNFEAWITGRKRFHGGDRMALPVVERADGRIKFNPLANWDKAALEAYMQAHGLPAHPLVEHGYPSLGCWPCTQPVEAGQDVRAGRWAGSEKSECGIHVARAPGAVNDLGGDI
ncbi:MAG: phosphoadenylyl-sulfate reductase [Phenylobacterium sp.]|uniref:phosphoadenylyl-sulfate reductase n=1 Tax=Phenylobacterium sp. TaxID=1871053 RepID=UPI00301B01D8